MHKGKEVERMAEQLDRQQVEHVADLAKLAFTDAELDKFTPKSKKSLTCSRNWKRSIRPAWNQ